MLLDGLRRFHSPPGSLSNAGRNTLWARTLLVEILAVAEKCHPNGTAAVKFPTISSPDPKQVIHGSTRQDRQGLCESPTRNGPA
jgi:hypothetical protein